MRPSYIWYPRRESNPQIPASKASRYTISLTGAWYPHLDSNQEILLVLSELRMPFRHEGLDARTGIAPVLRRFAGACVSTPPTCDMVPHLGNAPSRPEGLQFYRLSGFFSRLVRYMVSSLRIALRSFGLQPNALLLSYNDLVGEERIELSQHEPRSCVRP